MSDLKATAVSLLATSPLARASLPELSPEWAKGIRKRAETAAGKALVASNDLADDLEQAAVIAFWRASRSYDTARGVPFEHYAQRAIRRAMISELRKLNIPTAAGQVLWLGDPTLDPANLEDEVSSLVLDEVADRRQRVRRWISTCPPRLRDVFALVYEKGLTQREVAERLGITQPRVAQCHKQLLERATTGLAHLTAA